MLITYSVSDARFIGTVIAGRRIDVVVVVAQLGGGATLTTLKLVDCVTEAILRLAKAAFGVGVVARRRRGRRRGCGHDGEGERNEKE